jgi:hypothetical protein
VEKGGDKMGRAPRLQPIENGRGGDRGRRGGGMRRGEVGLRG